jgi:hypothetical protein
VDEDI